ncbi:DUF3040 domain-containing protein [Cellulomonas sp. C5510]|uniref:DUF3040 domain-containing protein n=1 Tax=Cellulomonas sp. C5510 TaxID=2871170 RepID=UPI001C9519FC|nr:DUF3040 domain-containing protein [Cellulomonas sp. C5510]QZN84472.1 DUF3040 domain-containing protein [Cellulomonas sp. C5510]
MPLSEYEQRVLEQMERQLTSDDPRLANTLTSRGRKPVLRYVLGGIGAVAGLLLLVGGAAASEVWLGVLGFVVMFASVAIAFTRLRGGSASGPTGVVRPDGSTTARPAPRKKGFMNRMEDRWDRRRDQGR